VEDRKTGNGQHKKIVNIIDRDKPGNLWHSIEINTVVVTWW
jgi:hypothetical protein